MTARCSHGLRWFRCRTCGEKWVPWAAEHLAAEDPFFSATPGPTTSFPWLEPQPLTFGTILQARKSMFERVGLKHLRVVE